MSLLFYFRYVHIFSPETPPLCTLLEMVGDGQKLGLRLQRRLCGSRQEALHHRILVEGRPAADGPEGRDLVGGAKGMERGERRARLGAWMGHTNVGGPSFPTTCWHRTQGAGVVSRI